MHTGADARYNGAMEEPSESATGCAHSFRLHEQDFEGPLDVLLKLVRQNGINIYDIPIADITEQYLDYLRNAENMDLDSATEFHAMAAMLLLIKSRTLLPVEIEEDGEPVDPRQELVERLVEYQKFKKLSDLMEEKEREAEWSIERRKLQHSLPFDDTELWEKADIWSLLKTFSNVMRNRLPGEDMRIFYEEISVGEKVTLIAELLETKGEFLFTELIVRDKCVMDIVCAFLAMLEAIKVRMIATFQNRMFGDILIRPAAAADREK